MHARLEPSEVELESEEGKSCKLLNGLVDREVQLEKRERGSESLHPSGANGHDEIRHLSVFRRPLGGIESQIISVLRGQTSEREDRR